MTKRSSPAGSVRGRRGASERRVQSRSTPSEAKPGSLWTCGPAPSPVATTLFSTSWYTLVLTFKPTSKMWGGMMWPSRETTPKTITVAVRRVVWCVELCPQALYHPDLHFEGAGNGPVVITWINREHKLYSGVSPISLVELCVTFRHDRRLLLLLGFVHNWPTSRWSATKKENRFSLNRNGIMLSFLGRQFYRSTLYIYWRVCVYIYFMYVYIYIYIYVCVCVCVYPFISLLLSLSLSYIYIYIYIYVCVCVCVCVQMCTRRAYIQIRNKHKFEVRVCMCIYIYMCVHVCIYTYIFSTYITVYVHMHNVYIYIYIYMCVCVCVCVYIYIHTHVPTYICLYYIHF